MEMSEEGRAVIDAARHAYGPSELDRKRVRGQLLARIAGVALVSTSAKASTSLLGSVGAKILVLGSVACVAGTVMMARSVWPVRAHSDTRSMQPSLSIQASPTQVEKARPEPATVPTDDRAIRAFDTSLATADSESSTLPATTRAGAVKVKAAASEPDVQGEIALLGKAQRALSSGQPAQALELLDEYTRTYPKGTLTEERNAAHIIALCKMGQVRQARAEASSFIRKSPQSPLSQRVRASCGDSLKAEGLSK